MKDWMRSAGIKSSDITDESLFRRRRQIMKASMVAGLTGVIGSEVHAKALPQPVNEWAFNATDELTSEKTATS